ncbi:glycosyltransferase family 87 protein [Sphingomonas sp. NIBR02145]|uniref:glycosyltransferase family 87 protein n=1 Tax=Sphingomonas sp. NIBR02145 TaxID=3014784 RepID=UPI0022B3C300|nr:glycosyltransferase family 87 protein [Sphingomonas sp. NIBR02145]WHU03063.1 glycosyltransferase family 87 protein [Sphingomonas sp. NIBR02145]
MTETPRPVRQSVWMEYALILPIIAAIGYTTWFFFYYHYLPQPFFYEPSGTWMDWYSLTRWSQKPGAYEIERTIYPPLSFVLMRMFSIPHCYALTYSEEARACDWLGGVALTAMWLGTVVLTFLSYRKVDRRTALPRAFAMTFGFPMIYAFERGNLLIFCYACILLGFGPLLKSAWLRWFFAGLAVNFKVYLVGAIVAPLLRRRWVAFEGMLLFTVLIYLASWYILGEGSPSQIYRNITSYSTGFGAQAALDLWFPATYLPLKTLMTGTFPIYTVVSSTMADGLVIGVTIFTRVIQASILIAAAAAWLRPEAVPPRRVVFLAIAFALSASEAGGYTEMLTLVFVFMEKRRGFERTTALYIAYFLSIPFDFTLGLLPPLVRYSYLANVEVIAQYGVGVMSLLRPGLSMIIAGLLSIQTVREVVADIRNQGWQNRWRYRFDWPVLPGVLRPSRPRQAGEEGPR